MNVVLKSRESAHFVKIAKITSKVNGPPAEDFVQYRDIYDCVPSLPLHFTLTSWSCGANEMTVEFIRKEHLRKNESTSDKTPFFEKMSCYG